MKIELTPLQKTLALHMDVVELIADHMHNKPVELADWLTVLSWKHGADDVVDVAQEVADKVQEAAQS